jgi:hypothetical protein
MNEMSNHEKVARTVWSGPYRHIEGRDGSQISVCNIELHIIASLVALQSGLSSRLDECLVAAGQALSAVSSAVRSLSY